MGAYRHLLVGMALLCMVFSGDIKAGTPTLDLGEKPGNGKEALETMSERETRVIGALACRDELRFLNAIDQGSNSGNWPYQYLIAKAAFLARNQSQAAPPGGGPIAPSKIPAGACLVWHENFSPNEDWKGQFVRKDFPDGQALWDEFLAAEDFSSRASAIAAALNGRYRQFGKPCENVAKATVYGYVNFLLTRDCLASQIAHVINNEDLGQWAIEKDAESEDRTFIPLKPGTDGLPCYGPFSSAGKGDWDMRVIEYARLEAFLARAVKADTTTTLEPIVSGALYKIRNQLLTLEGGPAREDYPVFWSCGNPDNRSGTAGNVDNYRDDLDTLGGGSSGIPDWLKWLLAFLLLAVIVFTLGAAAGAAGGALGTLIGSIGVAAVTAAMILVVVGIFFTLTIPETENHLLMQNVSTYLENKRLLAESDAGEKRRDKLVAQNKEVRLWLLERMARIAREDFIEYNSRSYGRVTHFALLNLADFACEHKPPIAVEGSERSVWCSEEDYALHLAASAVLELSAAKAAVGSVQARRVTPFRRNAVENVRFHDAWWYKRPMKEKCNDGETRDPDLDNERCRTAGPKRIMDMGHADHPVAALQFWTGATQHGPGHQASNESLTHMLWHATSTFRPGELILDLAIDKPDAMEQEFNHWTRERYSSGNRWLLTAGGDSAPFANVASIYGQEVPFGKDKDRGVGVPTTLMAYTASPGPRQDTYRELLRFNGREERWGEDDEGNPYVSFSSNFCVTTGFACGLRLEIPRPVAECLDEEKSPAMGRVRFLSSTTCSYYKDGDGTHENDFFAAVFGAGCRKTDGGDSCEWGFVQVVNSRDFKHRLEGPDGYIDQFEKNNVGHVARMGSAGGKYSLWSPATNKTIQFVPRNEDFDRSCRACGVIQHQEYRGGAKFIITHTKHEGRSIELDLSIPTSPWRKER